MMFPEIGNFLVFKENKTVLTYFLLFIEPMNRKNYYGADTATATSKRSHSMIYQYYVYRNCLGMGLVNPRSHERPGRARENAVYPTSYVKIPSHQLIGRVS
jgi:hypothetical protein